MAAKKRTSRNQVVRNGKAVGGTPKRGQHKTVALAPKTDDDSSSIRWSFAWMDTVSYTHLTLPTILLV